MAEAPLFDDNQRQLIKALFSAEVTRMMTMIEIAEPKGNVLELPSVEMLMSNLAKSIASFIPPATASQISDLFSMDPELKTLAMEAANGFRQALAKTQQQHQKTGLVSIVNASSNKKPSYKTIDENQRNILKALIMAEEARMLTLLDIKSREDMIAELPTAESMMNDIAENIAMYMPPAKPEEISELFASDPLLRTLALNTAQAFRQAIVNKLKASKESGGNSSGSTGAQAMDTSPMVAPNGVVSPGAAPAPTSIEEKNSAQRQADIKWTYLKPSAKGSSILS